MAWRARIDDLLVTQTGDDLLIYDRATQALHHLDSLSSWVWRSLDAHSSLNALTASAQTAFPGRVTSESVAMALRQLHEAGLLEGDVPIAEGQSRRTLLKRAAVGGAMLPAIASITVPMAAAAQSTECTTPPNPSVYMVSLIECANVRAWATGFCPYAIVLIDIYMRVDSTGEEIFYRSTSMFMDDTGTGNTVTPAVPGYQYRAVVGGVGSEWYANTEC